LHAFTPSRYQPPLPAERFIVHTPADSEAVPLDVLFVGGGPAGLAGAIELARLARLDSEHDDGSGASLADLQIGVLEKAESLGDHNLSGAVVNPVAFRALFPDLTDADFPFRLPVEKEAVYLLTAGHALRIPAPPTMRNHGNYIASICEIVRWLGGKAEELGVNILTGFPAQSLLVQDGAVQGVRTAPSGLQRDGNPGPGYTPPTDISARVTVLCEGTRGALAQAWLAQQNIGSANPPLYALGVKEIWETKVPFEGIVHTLGWPVPMSAFGGTFLYAMEPNLLALGIVVGLDSPDAGLDVHEMLQRLKMHPFFRRLLDGGEMVEWGARTIPEGGYYALPQRRSGAGLLIAGDAAGFVEVASLKGIHYAMQSGILAARAIFKALKRNDVGSDALSGYDAMVNESYIIHDLHERRNMRLAFHSDGFLLGGAKASLMSVSGGRLFGGRISVERDADVERSANGAAPFRPDGKLTFDKLEAVFKSGNVTRDTIPSHLVVGEDVPPHVADFYAHMCPAGVYERSGDKLVVNAPNCVDCRATDVLGPRWTPREGGSGPRYRRM
jgi:electron-transferring-flavoprotein dehydrogenase